MDKQAIQAQLDAFQVEWDAAWENLVESVMARKRPGATKWPREAVRTGWGGDLTVNTASYGKVSAEAVLGGEAEPIEILATEDGGRADIFTWHDVATDGEMGEAIYVERWVPEGRTFHGYVDEVSRKVVQTG